MKILSPNNRKKSQFLSKYAIWLMCKKKGYRISPIFKLIDLNVFYLCLKKALLHRMNKFFNWYSPTSYIWMSFQDNTKKMRLHGRHSKKSKWNSDNEISRHVELKWHFYKMKFAYKNDIKKRSMQNNFWILLLILNWRDPVGLQTRSGLLQTLTLRIHQGFLTCYIIYLWGEHLFTVNTTEHEES